MMEAAVADPIACLLYALMTWLAQSWRFALLNIIIIAAPGAHAAWLRLLEHRIVSPPSQAAAAG